MALTLEARAAHKPTLDKVMAILASAGFGDATAVQRGSEIYKPDHAHPFDAMGIVFGGRFIVRTGNITFDCSPDPATGFSKPFHVPSMQLHSEQTGKDGALLVVGRRWPEGELERQREGVMKLLPTKSEEQKGGPKL